MTTTAIGDYGLLSDCHSAALVDRKGSVDWLCLPRFDSPALFGRLLDEQAGHWCIHPSGDFEATRRYLEATMILETTFRTASGTAVLLDAMALGRNERGHEIGAHSPRALLRRVVCLQGTVELELEFAPRPEYGIVAPLLTRAEGGIFGRGGATMMLLSAPCELTVEGASAHARFSLKAGDSMGFALQHRTSAETAPERWDQDVIAARIEDTATAWRTWSAMHQRYEGPWRDLVHHSGRVLQALTFYPTGAIVAAATTSLPEVAGGPRNWDYRFTWVRDATLTLDALWVAACPDEARRFFDFLAGVALSKIQLGARLQVMFGVGGEHDLTERELSHLSCWRGSRPVRIGNDAWSQRQLDVYGEVLAAVDRLRDELRNLDAVTRHFLAEVADAAAARWQEKDQGIWEVSGEPRDFLYSKLMCWVALDRAIGLAPLLEAKDRVEHWRAVRDEIRQVILERGWSERARAFTQSFGSDELDASSLMMPIVGFLPANDPRMLATIDAIADRLTDENGLVYRYRTADGLAGEEGAFVLCTFWLAQALALAGEVERAREVFARAAAFANDLGLLAEEVDSRSGELLGNFPQAFSHIGLINAAWAITQAEERRARGEGVVEEQDGPGLPAP